MMSNLDKAEREARAEIEGLRADLEIAERCRRFELAEKQREVDCALANLARQAEEHTRERAADKARIAALERECGSDAATERRAITIEEKLLVLETAIAATQVTPEDADTIEKRLTIFASNLHHRGAKWRTADVLEFVLAELARQAEAHAARIDDA